MDNSESSKQVMEAMAAFERVEQAHRALDTFRLMTRLLAAEDKEARMAAFANALEGHDEDALARPARRVLCAIATAASMQAAQTRTLNRVKYAQSIEVRALCHAITAMLDEFDLRVTLGRLDEVSPLTEVLNKTAGTLLAFAHWAGEVDRG